MSVSSRIFTVALLPAGSHTIDPITVTPSDGGAGTFVPATVVLSTVAPSGTFTHTPASYGVKTVSSTNDGGLTNPSPVTYSPLANAYTLSGPSSGTTGAASTNFTVALPVGGAVTGTVTVTPDDGAAVGGFTPSTVSLTTVAPSATFTYTPAADAVATISVTNNGGLTNPANLTYTSTTFIPFTPTDIAGLKAWYKADALVLTDGAAVASWVDSSGSGNTATQGTGANQPIYKTNIINGKPVVRFDGSNDSLLLSSEPVGGPVSSSSFVVLRINVVPASQIAFACAICFGTGSVGGRIAVALSGTTNWGTYLVSSSELSSGENLALSTPVLLEATTSGAGTTLYRDGVSKATNASWIYGATAQIGNDGTTRYLNGDIAEILVYDSVLSPTDRVSVETYLKSKYAIA